MIRGDILRVAMSKMSAPYYMLNHRIRGLVFHFKKTVIFIGFYFFGKSIQKHPDSVCENDVRNTLSQKSREAKKRSAMRINGNKPKGKNTMKEKNRNKIIARSPAGI